jgi:hypothetical protein
VSIFYYRDRANTTTNVTDATTSVMVGQRIVLCVAINNLGTSTVNSNTQIWSIPGSTIGDYKADDSAGTVSPVDYSGTSCPAGTNWLSGAAFYWADAGPSRLIQFTVQYSIQLNDGNTYSAHSTFRLTSPLTVVTTHPAISLGKSSRPPNGDYAGLTSNLFFEVSVDASVPGSSLKWVQKVKSAASRRHQTGGLGGYWERQDFPANLLDNVYPYDTGFVTTDMPGLKLLGSCDDEMFYLDFDMYLMFEPNVTDTSVRPIPINKVSWSFSIEMVKDSTGLWIVVPATTRATEPVIVQAQPLFTNNTTRDIPQWSDNVANYVSGWVVEE